MRFVSRAAIAALVLLSFAPLVQAAPSLRLSDLRCEYHVNPLGLDETHPRLSWILESNWRGEKQAAYQIVAASSQRNLAANRFDLWDTGRVASDATMQIAYTGRPLASEAEAWWQVCVWNQAGRRSAWSAPAHWTMGLRAGDWKAQWIGLNALPGPAPSPEARAIAGLDWVWFPEGNPAADAPAGTRYFARSIELPAGRAIKAARFFLTADDQFTLYVNGKEAAKSSGTFVWRKIHNVDVTPLLKSGSNTLAITASNEASSAGLIGRLQIEFESGDPVSVPIDASWQATTMAGRSWPIVLLGGHWVAAKEIAALGDAPWGNIGQGSTPAIPPSPYVRQTFAVSKPIARAIVYATALGLYELHLNGQRVSNDVFTPGWTDYHKRVPYQTYDVTNLLRRGANALGLIVGDGWTTGHVGNGGRNRYGLNRPRVAAQLNIVYADGTRQTVATNAAWKAAYGPILEQDLLDGETFDARRELTGWDTPNFNDAGWQSANLYDDVHPLIEAHRGVPVRRLGELHPRRITQPTPGTWIFDLGQNMVGRARLAVSGPAGTKVTLRFAEMLNPDGTVYVTNLRGARSIDYYTLRGGGRETWEPRFTFHGFRYVELTGYPGRPGADAVTGVVLGSAMPPAGTFDCSNPLVNQLQRNIVWGQRGNFLEVPTDCPQRDERLGWMGDAQIFARTACDNADVAAFFSQWMVDVEDAMRGDAFADVSPDVCCGAGTAAWADAGIIVPWTMYQVYGDTRIIEKHYGAMARYVAWMEAHSQELLRPAEGYGDWLAIGADTPKDVIATAYFAYSTSLLAKMAFAIGKRDDALKYENLFTRIRDAFNKAYVSPDGHIKGDTQTDYLLALRMNLLPPEKQALAARYLVEDIARRNNHLSTGFVGVGYMNPTLTQFGHTDVAYQLLLQDTFPSWGYSIRQGATTIWERWDGWTRDKGFQDPGMNSFNHYSLGSVGQWMFATAGGIETDEPGFKHILIHPQPGGGLTFAHATYNSVRGRVESRWRIEKSAFLLNVTIPPNTMATVVLPPGRVRESGRTLDKAKGVYLSRANNGGTALEVESGSYQFAVLR